MDVVLAIVRFFVLVNSLWLNIGAHALAINKSEKIIARNTSCENTATSRSCWGDYDIDTDYYNVIPDTGVTGEVSFFVLFFASSLLGS